MKNFKKAFVIALAIMLAYCTGYAWITVSEPQNSVTRSVQIAVDESAQGKLLIGENSMALGEDSLEGTETKSLKPCTSEDGKTFRDEEGNKATAGYVDSYTVYLKSSDTPHGLQISNLVISGDGSEDDIAQALRIAVSYGSEVKIFDPSSPVGEVYSLSVSNRDVTPLTVITWFEGTDEACTTDNALASTGAIEVKVVLGLV